MSKTIDELIGAPQKGERLPNGALVLDSIIIERDVQPEGDYYYGLVLAMGEREFVVWNLGVKPDGSIETWNGRYADTIQRAVDVYREKVSGR